MTGMIDWATDRARMILVFVAMSLAAGILAYTSLPKEGEPDIDIPALFVSVPFPGISAEDSEKLIVKPLENKLRDINGLKTMSATASEGYGGVALEFEFGWDKSVVKEMGNKIGKVGANFEPPNPASVVEEADVYGETKEQRKKRRESNFQNLISP